MTETSADAGDFTSPKSAPPMGVVLEGDLSPSEFDDHRPLAAQAIRAMLLLAAGLAIVLVATRRIDALAGLGAGIGVGVVDVVMLRRGLDRFARSPQTSARTLGTSMFTRFVSIGVLLGLVLCLHGLNPAAAIVGFLLMPVAVGVVGARDARRRRLALGAA